MFAGEERYLLRWCGVDSISRVSPRNEVAARCATSRATIYRVIRHGEFPKPVKTFLGASCWVPSEIDQWVSDRVQAHGVTGL
ncbi:MAG: AlpA family phage regulatory protein [Pseudomonadota bacterium]